MDMIPSPEEIKQAVFDLSADSAPGPDGFSGCFYRHYWDIIHDDLTKAIIHCWNAGSIPNGVNSSFIILLAKVRGANTLRNFRPIGLSNFFFKIFTKILATRLGTVLDKLVSEEQAAFMKGRNIHENISLALEMVNELHYKRKDGNIGLKLDISQAFDTSARISVILNGSPEGYFKINRGLRQGDPLSPLIFVLIEDVLSRNITKLFRDKKMTPMTCWVVISVIQVRLFVVKRVLFDRHISNVVEKIKNQLAGWRGRLLSFHDRIVLVKSVIASYYIHNMAIYKWPRKFILQCERAICNFIWSGDSNINRVVVVAFDKICCPFEEGGLGLTRMATMNKALIMKLWWKIHNSTKKWAIFLKNTKVLIGDGRDTSLYYDIWFDKTSIADVLNDYSLDATTRVSDILKDGLWDIPEIHLQYLIAAGLELNRMPIPMGGADVRVWLPELKGEFSVKSATELLRQKYSRLEGTQLLWRKEVHPVLAAQNWKFLHGACATYDLIRRRSELWQLRNKAVLEHKKPNWSIFHKRVLKLIQDYSIRLKGHMNNSADDVVLLNYFRVQHRSVKLHHPVACFWLPPEANELQFCCDGAARGNPGVAGAGVVARDEHCSVLGAMSIGLGVTTNYLA
ncbi:uncharacterized protein LOC113343598 [Papaver somniferum]|uniref:uncharacterized protein LOC113343598 n=1 Tax=Papaver somniferum TaxID=3469 RepID=UPI000E6FEA28|nr:uncharacterized protein LOC113343598 [Papaver somniferum]